MNGMKHKTLRTIRLFNNFLHFNLITFTYIIIEQLKTGKIIDCFLRVENTFFSSSILNVFKFEEDLDKPNSIVYNIMHLDKCSPLPRPPIMPTLGICQAWWQSDSEKTTPPASEKIHKRQGF